MGLIEISLLRNKASRAGISDISNSLNSAILHTTSFNNDTIAALSAEFKNQFSLSASGDLAYIIKLSNGLKLADVVSRLSKIL